MLKMLLFWSVSQEKCNMSAGLPADSVLPEAALVGSVQAAAFAVREVRGLLSGLPAVGGLPHQRQLRARCRRRLRLLLPPACAARVGRPHEPDEARIGAHRLHRYSKRYTLLTSHFSLPALSHSLPSILYTLTVSL